MSPSHFKCIQILYYDSKTDLSYSQQNYVIYFHSDNELLDCDCDSNLK